MSIATATPSREVVLRLPHKGEVAACPVRIEPDGAGFTFVNPDSLDHVVTVDGSGCAECSCPDAFYRQRECKHVLALRAAGLIAEPVAEPTAKPEAVAPGVCRAPVLSLDGGDLIATFAGDAPRAVVRILTLWRYRPEQGGASWRLECANRAEIDRALRLTALVLDGTI